MALIIGISQYTEVSNLKFADADALEFSQLLTNFSGYEKNNVKVLLNQQATKKRIVDEIAKVIEESKKKPLDNFIFMFAGHGVEGKIKRVGASKKIEEMDTNIFLAPSDASLNENNFYQSSSSNVVTNETFINKEWLAKQISSVKAKNVSILLDSCYSGNKSFFNLLEKEEGVLNYEVFNQAFNSSIIKGGVATPSEKNSLVNDFPKLAYLASSRDDQASAEYDELRHGAMSYVIFEYLKRVRKSTPINHQKIVNISELYTNIGLLFKETKVDGASLDSQHQPILYAIPDMNFVKDMQFLAIQGIFSGDEKLQTSVLKLLLDYAEVEIYVDGTKVAFNKGSQYQMPVGKHSVEIYIPSTGYRYSFTKDFQQSQVYEEPISLYGSLEIASLLDDKGEKLPGPQLEVYIDGKFVEKSKLFKTKLLAGTHTVDVKLMHVTKTKNVEIRPDSPLRINYSVKNQSAPPDDRGVKNVIF
ncbi:caspase family protein [Polynucleobacter paneuropaeus]|nr:caspase family protein [Polynucleobacter paneuropaeus]